MDLDGLKEINETFGMEMGDRVLIHAADSFKKVLREYDTCVRYAGDEFYVVLPGISKEDSGKIIERIKGCVAEMEIDQAEGGSQRIGVTVGAAYFPDDGLDIETLISSAHSRLYREKQARAGKKSEAPVEREALAQDV
jgi:diguanylate cyclase (GGDEF)-like protein